MPHKDPQRAKEYQAEYYLRTKDRYRDSRLASVKRQRSENRELIRTSKSKPCHDCGVQYPYYVMQFDHLDGESKSFNLGDHEGRTRGILLSEIAKCEVVCANCHAERTHQRQQTTAV